MAKFESVGDFERWLAQREDARRHQDAIVLATRAALRVLPLGGPEWQLAWPNERELALTLEAFRALAIARVAAVGATRSGVLGSLAEAAANRIAHADMAPLPDAETYAAMAAASAAFTAAHISASATGAVSYAHDAAVAFTVPIGSNLLATAYAALSTDADLLEIGGKSTQLARRALWLDETGRKMKRPPGIFGGRWEAMKSALLSVGDDWDVWTSWYDAVLAGSSPYPALKAKAARELELRIALLPDALWEKGPQAVNAVIKGMIAEASGGALIDGEDGGLVPQATPDAPPAVPKPRPAAIEPIILDDGRIGLPGVPLAADIAADSLSAALSAARKGFEELAEDVASANVDKRAVAVLKRIASRIPDAAPAQDKLFRLAHVEDLLDGYAKTVNDEWPPLLASSYLALSLQFQRTMRQFPRWREFKRNAEKDRLTEEQIDAAAPLVVSITKTLQGAEADRFVEPALPKALENLAEPLGAAETDNRGPELPIDIIEAGKERLAEDVLESTNNILKKIAEVTLAAWQTTKPELAPFGRGARRYLKGLGTGFEKEADEMGPRDGAKVFKWGRRVLLSLGGYGFVSATGLLDKLPSSFRWLKDVIDFLSKLGS
jgi:hypothetical protein